jgi:hypothetical protein
MISTAWHGQLYAIRPHDPENMPSFHTTETQREVLPCQTGHDGVILHVSFSNMTPLKIGGR